MVYRFFGFDLFTFNVDTDGGFYLDILCVSTTDWEGSLIHLERYCDSWKFDFLWLRNLYLRMVEK